MTSLLDCRDERRHTLVVSRVMRDATLRSVSYEVIERFESLWRKGEQPVLDRLDDVVKSCDPVVISGLVKAELRARYERGEVADVEDYLRRYSTLRDDRERALSVIYEEFCLREENGHSAEAEQFCDRFEPWRDSLASQLRYHRMLSQVVGTTRRPRYPQPGEFFADKFRLRSILGEGGAGRVYLAEQPDLGDRAVALKISASTSKEPSIQGRLVHAHIVPVWSVTEDALSGLRGLCMPYQPGRSLDSVIRILEPARGRSRRAIEIWKSLGSGAEPCGPSAAEAVGWRGFPARGGYVDGAAWIVSRIARALAHAHGEGILHLDVKPANILLTFSSGPQLLDFNLAHDPHTADQAEAALRGGTLPYMAPEQLRAFLDPSAWSRVGPAADLFSLGLVLKELLTGQRPVAEDIDDDSLPRLINDILDARALPPRSVRENNPDIPHALAAIVAKCLHCDPAARYASAQHLAEDLDRYLKRQNPRHVVNPCQSERVRNFLFRYRLPLAGIAAGLSVFVTAPWAHSQLFPEPSADVRVAVSVSDQSQFEYLHRDAAPEVTKSWLQNQEILRTHPDSYRACLTLAHLANVSNKDYRLSIEYYDRALSVMDRLQIRPVVYVDPLINRATVSNFLGVATQQETATKHSLSQARPYYQSAAADLERVSELSKSNGILITISDRFRIAFQSARARTALGDIAWGLDDNRLDALEFYESAQLEAQNARALLKEMQLGGSDAAERTRLALDFPKLYKAVDLLLKEGNNRIRDVREEVSGTGEETAARD